MFYGSSGGSDPLNMSKSDILRGIITEKLSTAAREILAVVERTVADYEQEASGFRQQIDRQRRQLELLQPQVRLHRRDVEAAERHKLTGNLSEDEEAEEDPEAISKRTQEDPKDPNYKSSPRFSFSRVQAARRRRTRISDSQNHITLRIWFLEDSKTEVLSKTVFRKRPVSVLKCPRGLPEASFLDLLRSSFPRLAEGEPFDLLTSDKSRRLHPLAAATPEEICRVGDPTLYVRLKKVEVKMEVGQHLLNEATSTDPVVLKSDETEFHTSSVGGAVGSIGSASRLQEQEAARGNMVCIGTQITWNEVVKVKEEEGSGPDRALDPDLSEIHESRVQISSAEGSSGSEEDSQSFTSTSESDDLETDDDSSDSSSDTDQTPDEAVGCNRDTEPQPQPQPQPQRKTYNLTCVVCGTWYRQLGSLISHIWNHVNEPHGVCGVCGEKFESVETLKEHLTSHKKGYICWLCGKFLLSSTTLNRHIAKHMVGSQIKCDICSKTFSTMSALQGHSRVHLEKQCGLCLKSFALKSDLIAHSKLHARAGKNHGGAHSEASPSPRRYACKLCAETFSLEVSLRAHETKHATKGWPFVCRICDKTFQTNQNLTAHARTHVTGGSFVCNLCNMSFLSEETLKVHMIVHLDETPYKCQECGRCFKRLSYLVNHSKTHSSVKLRVCGKVCNGQEALEGLMRVHNRETTVEQNRHPDQRSGNPPEEPRRPSPTS